MITRIALFISLLALFYYYCKNDAETQIRQPNDLNQIEVPSEISPLFDFENLPEGSLSTDSSHHLISSQQLFKESSEIVLSSTAQNY